MRSLLGDLSPEVAGDIFDRGLILTGGGASLEGLPSYLEKELNLDVRVADDPRFAIVRGYRNSMTNRCCCDAYHAPNHTH